MTRAQEAPRTGPAPTPPGLRAGPAHRGLAAGVAATAMLTAALGLATGDLHGADEATVQMLRGFDAVTLVVIGPALLLALRAERRGSGTGSLVVSSLLAYLAYTWVYYLLGTGFTDLLLVHAALFSATLVALGLSLRGMVSADLVERTHRAQVHIPAVVLALLAAALGAMWGLACVVYALDGTVPAGSSLVESDTIVHLGVVLDLTVLVPLYAAAAVLLWRRRPVGFVLAVLALVSGTLHQVGYIVAVAFQWVADVPGSVFMDPFEPLILLLYVVATAVLLRRSK